MWVFHRACLLYVCAFVFAYVLFFTTTTPHTTKIPHPCLWYGCVCVCGMLCRARFRVRAARTRFICMFVRSERATVVNSGVNLLKVFKSAPTSSPGRVDIITATARMYIHMCGGGGTRKQKKNSENLACAPCRQGNVRDMFVVCELTTAFFLIDLQICELYVCCGGANRQNTQKQSTHVGRRAASAPTRREAEIQFKLSAVDDVYATHATFHT